MIVTKDDAYRVRSKAQVRSKVDRFSDYRIKTKTVVFVLTPRISSWRCIGC